MGVFGRLFRPKKDIEILESNIKDSFFRVSSDVQSLKTWVVHLHKAQSMLDEKHSAHRDISKRETDLLVEKIGRLENDQKNLSAYLSQLIDYLQKKAEHESRFASKLELLKSRREIGSNLTSSEGSVRTKFVPASEHAKEVRQLPKHTAQTAFEEKLLRRIRQQRKEYVLQKMVEATQEGEFGTNELEKLIVEQKQLCGRTSFFSYLKELKIQSILEDSLVGKRKILVSKHKIVRKSER